MYGQLNIVAKKKYHYKLGLTFKNAPDLHTKYNLQMSGKVYSNRSYFR